MNQPLKTKTNIERSNAILEYFRTHPYISSSAVANDVGYDPSSLAKLINQTGRLVAIPQKHVPDFERVLSHYGFTS